LTEWSACDSLPVDHVGVRGLLPETGHPVRNLATAPNSSRIPVSECLVRLVLMRQWAVEGSRASLDASIPGRRRRSL
jgi:hypothetical protein